MIAVSVSVSFLVVDEHLVKDSVVASNVESYVTEPVLVRVFRNRSWIKSNIYMKNAIIRMIEVT